MSDDDDISQRDTKESALGPDEVDSLGNLPSFPDREEFVKTQEMDEVMPSSMSGTNPLHRAPLDSTQRYEVPDDLLQMAMRSQEMQILAEPDSEPEIEWREFVGVVDPHGRIVLPSRVQQDLRGKKLRVKYVVDGE